MLYKLSFSSPHLPVNLQGVPAISAWYMPPSAYPVGFLHNFTPWVLLMLCPFLILAQPNPIGPWLLLSQVLAQISPAVTPPTPDLPHGSGHCPHSPSPDTSDIPQVPRRQLPAGQEGQMLPFQLPMGIPCSETEA